MSEPPKGNSPRNAEKLLKIKPPPSKKTKKFDYFLENDSRPIYFYADLIIIEA